MNATGVSVAGCKSFIGSILLGILPFSNSGLCIDDVPPSYISFIESLAVDITRVTDKKVMDRIKGLKHQADGTSLELLWSALIPGFSSGDVNLRKKLLEAFRESGILQPSQDMRFRNLKEEYSIARKFLEDPDPEIRAEAVKFLGGTFSRTIGLPDEDFEKDLIKCAKEDKRVAVRKAAHVWLKIWRESNARRPQCLVNLSSGFAQNSELN